MRWTCHTLYQFLDLEKMQSNRSVGFFFIFSFFFFKVEFVARVGSLDGRLHMGSCEQVWSK